LLHVRYLDLSVFVLLFCSISISAVSVSRVLSRRSFVLLYCREERRLFGLSIVGELPYIAVYGWSPGLRALSWSWIREYSVKREESE
jgi:hypothetical protein